MSVSAAEATFPEARFRAHLPPSHQGDSNNNVKGGGKSTALLRATGDVLIPECFAAHVDFISGLTELWAGSRTNLAGYGGGRGGGGVLGKRDGGGAGKKDPARGLFGAGPGMEVYQDHVLRQKKEST